MERYTYITKITFLFVLMYVVQHFAFIFFQKMKSFMPEVWLIMVYRPSTKCGNYINKFTSLFTWGIHQTPPPVPSTEPVLASISPRRSLPKYPQNPQ